MKTFASQSVTWYWISSRVSRALRGEMVAPAFHTANNVSSSSGLFDIITATRSPGWTFSSSTRPEASAEARSSTSRYVRRSVPSCQMIAGRSGWWRAASARISPRFMLALSAVDRDDRVLHEPEALEHAEQLVVPEGLAGRGEADLLVATFEELGGGVGVEETGLLVVAVPVEHGVDPAQRPGGVHGVDRDVDPGVLPGRHLRSDPTRLLVEDRQLLLELETLDALQDGGHQPGDGHHEWPVDDPAEDLDVLDPGVVLEPDGVRRPAPRECESKLVLAGHDDVVEAGVGGPL